jgi:hypothetical protein
MAISGIQVINVGLPNESAGSDSLYTAFKKTANNFSNLFACASPYNTFAGGVGISTNADANTNTVTITNTGVTALSAGTGIVLSSNTGNITISSTGGGGGNGGGTVTSVGLVPVSNTRLTDTNSPIVSNGTMGIDLANSGVTAGSYTYPSMTVDQYGRVTSIANAASVGTVTSVGMVTSGIGIQLSGSPITTAGNITIVNTGVTRLSAGTGINLSGSNGNVTISTTTTSGTVTSVGLSSSSLTVTNSPITSVGTIGIELPANVTVTGQLLLSSSENLANGSAANLSTTASYFSTAAASTATLAAGSTGQIKTFMMVADGGDMIITVTNAGWKSSGTGTITFNDIGDGCTLQYINSKWFCIGQNGVVFG